LFFHECRLKYKDSISSLTEHYILFLQAQAVANGAVENAVLDQPANAAADNAVVGENPEIQEEQVDEEEEDNEDEEDAVVEDAADANNGAQGNR